jgi:hypothetical protein
MKILRDPTSFGVYDLRVGGVRRRVVIIGEVHDIVRCQKDKDGIGLSDFIRDYHQSIGKEKVLDIYSESFYVGSKKLGWLPTLYYLLRETSHLDDARALFYIRKRLDACSPKFNFSLYECPENVRIHLCDVRFVREMDYSFRKRTSIDCATDKLFKVGLLYINQDKMPRVVRVVRGLVAFIKRFLNDTKDSVYHTKLTEHILKKTKVLKQIENVPSKVVRNTLTKWSHDLYDNAITNARSKLEKFDKEYGATLGAQKGLEYVSDACQRSFIEFVSLPILYVISVFMDMYLTARLLRKFADDTFADNAIVYAGEFHTKQYRMLMKILGARQVFFKSSLKEDGSYVSCVDITKFCKDQMKKK